MLSSGVCGSARADQPYNVCRLAVFLVRLRRSRKRITLVSLCAFAKCPISQPPYPPLQFEFGVTTVSISRPYIRGLIAKS